MGNFSELLHKNLPSKRFVESIDDLMDDVAYKFGMDSLDDDSDTPNPIDMDDMQDSSIGADDYSDAAPVATSPADLECGSQCGSQCESKCGPSVTEEGDDEDFDPDNLSDEELAALDKELSDELLDDTALDGEEDVDLEPEEEVEADDMMSVAATSMLVNDELNAEEKVKFAEEDGAIAVNEGFMTVSDITELRGEKVVTEAKYNKKMLIRLDAAAKQKQLYALAVNVSAAARKDPDYLKLKKVMRMRKILRAKLDRKYHAEAMKRMKVYFRRLKNSKSGILSKIGNAISNKLNKIQNLTKA